MSDQKEQSQRAERRQYTSEYKLRILDEIDHSREAGEIGAILRREGLYSQVISKWRQQRQRGSLDAGVENTRGPKPNPEAAELKRLRKENERLRTRLENAELIIEVQKKVAVLLEKYLDPTQNSSEK